MNAASVWKRYLAVRTNMNTKHMHVMQRSRKRSRPRTSHPETSIYTSIRMYWENLSAQDRLLALFLDEPELVKQLYKLNLSLLCVGLMQRHLKTPTSKSTEKAKADPTYELLEAMEFMDIGTGILTVKSELVEEGSRIFTLVGAVLEGFCSTMHILNENEFNALFVNESEVISTWEDYEKLIAMLIEQLLLKSYSMHLDKQATLQMEELLVQVSLEDTKKKTSSDKKKKKKHKKKTSEKKIPESVTESESEPENEIDLMIQDGDTATKIECISLDTKTLVLSALNPLAQEYCPVMDISSPISGKRKLDEFILQIEWDDVIDSDEEGDEGSDQGNEFIPFHRREKYRRVQDDTTELEWQLQHLYAASATMLGWDFTHQREIHVTRNHSLPWDEEMIWKTAPADVVRYYFPPVHPTSMSAMGKQHPPLTLQVPPIIWPHPPPQSSQYYYYFPPLAPPASPTSTPIFPPLIPIQHQFQQKTRQDKSILAPVSFWDSVSSSSVMRPPCKVPPHPVNDKSPSIISTSTDFHLPYFKETTRKPPISSFETTPDKDLSSAAQVD